MRLFFKKILIFSLFFYIISTFTFADNVTISASPNINARHAVVLDRASKTILFGKEENECCKMASTTKIMTCVIAIENSNLNTIVKVSSKAAHTGGSRLGLSTNDELSVESLLYGLMLCSGNDAAVALAEYIGGNVEEFANLMNNKASELGLLNTHFVTPHGLDSDDHYTTAYDLALLTDYALLNETFKKFVSTKSITININNKAKNISNTNELLGYLDGVYGVKTGFTNGANRCLVTSCKRGNLDIVCVVLGCDTKKFRTQDSINLINYIFENFSMYNIKDDIYNTFEKWKMLYQYSFNIDKGISNFLDLYIDENDFPYSSIAINNTDIKNIKINFNFNNSLNAPIQANSILGSISFDINSLNYFSINIKSSNLVNKKTPLFYLNYFLKNFILYFGQLSK